MRLQIDSYLSITWRRWVTKARRNSDRGVRSDCAAPAGRLRGRLFSKFPFRIFRSRDAVGFFCRNPKTVLPRDPELLPGQWRLRLATPSAGSAVRRRSRWVDG